MIMKPGLYIIATPIGNLSDITYRSLEVFKNVDFILAEDTRETKKILNRYEIEAQTVSYRDQNHNKIMPKVLEKLSLGLSLGLVSDSGTPTISDPGYKLVKEVKEAGYDVYTIPGPSAVISALSISGLPTDRFIFLGFLPKSKGKREALLTKYTELESTLVIYESPHRLKKLLEQLLEIVGPDRDVSVANNLTKLSEFAITKKLSEIISHWEDKTPKGEFVVMVSK